MYVEEVEVEDDNDGSLPMFNSKRGAGADVATLGACFVNREVGLPLMSMPAFVGEPVLGLRSARTFVFDLVGDMVMDGWMDWRVVVGVMVVVGSGRRFEDQVLFCWNFLRRR